MSIKCSVFIATSLDGFIARKNGDLDWLPKSDDMAGSEDYGYNKFFNSIDTLVIGRKTYELASTFQEWPYHGKKVVVLSSSYPKAKTFLANGVEGVSSSPKKLVQQLELEGLKHIYIDGGKTIQTFLQEGLIQEMTITRIPVLIGGGIPLFGSLAHDLKLRHLATKSFASGFVQSKYRLEHAA